jgi:hypothetical protein
MNRKLAAMLLVGATALSLNACAAPALHSTPRPTVTAASVQEDDPGWDCNTMGNRICGDPQGTYASEAWKAWDATPEVWRKLYIDTSRPHRMEYVGYATEPKRVAGTVAVPMGPTASHPYFVFRAVEGK